MKKWVLLIMLATTLAGFSHEGLHQQIAVITQKIEQNPSNDTLYIKRAELYRFHKEIDLAIKDLKKADKLNPSKSLSSIQWAQIYKELHKPDSALMYLNIFEKYFNDLSSAKHLRVDLLEMQNKLDQAIDLQDSILKASTKPRPSDYNQMLRLLEKQKGPDRLQRSLAYIEEGQRKIGYLLMWNQTKLNLYKDYKMYPEALNLLDQMIEEANRKEWLQFKKAEVFEESGDIKQAHIFYLKSLNSIEELPQHLQFNPKVRELKSEIQKKCSKYWANNGN